MKYDYTALIAGGLGPDVWDEEMPISAVDFQDAANQAIAYAKERGGDVVLLEQDV